MGTNPPFRCVTASLNVIDLQPTPLTDKITLRVKVEKIEGYRVTIHVDLYGVGELCAKGNVLVVAVPGKWIKKWVDQP